jgi:hypothetical protein
MGGACSPAAYISSVSPLLIAALNPPTVKVRSCQPIACSAWATAQ